MKLIILLVAATTLMLAAGCFSYIPEDEWDDFVMEACQHNHDQAAYNRCYRDGTRSRTVCYDAEGTTVCRDRPYGTCDRAKLGAVPLEQPGPPRDSLGCERKPPSRSDNVPAAVLPIAPATGSLNAAGRQPTVS